MTTYANATKSTTRFVSQEFSVYVPNTVSQVLEGSEIITTSPLTQKLFSGSIIETGETFQALYSGFVTSAQFRLQNIGSPTGNATAKLYAITGTLGTNGKPTGSALATSDPVDVSTITSTGYVTFTFPALSQYWITALTNYCIALSYSSGDTNNCIRAFYTTAGTSVGNSFSFVSSYSTSASIKANFFVYANALTMTTVNPTWDDMNVAWDDAEGTWNSSKTIYTRQAKNSTSFTNQTKN